MPQKFSTMRASEAVRVKLKALADASGRTIDEVLETVLWSVGPDLKVIQTEAMRDLSRQIRARMDAKVGRGRAVRTVAPPPPAEVRLSHGPVPVGGRFDHSTWDFSKLKIGGPALAIAEGIHYGARIAANRYRASHEGWNFQMIGRNGVFYLSRIAVEEPE